SEIYSDPALRQMLLVESRGGIDEVALKELAEHTRKQFAEIEPPLEERKAIDEQELEPDDYAGTVDVEDLPVLLYVQKLLAGKLQVGSKGITKYSHLVVDEAQDLAPLELAILGETLHANSSVTVAGDAAQQSDPSVVFQGWDATLNYLG